MDKELSRMLAEEEGRQLLEELESFKDSQKDKIFETLKEDAEKAKLERYTYLGIEMTIDYIDQLRQLSKRQQKTDTTA